MIFFLSKSTEVQLNLSRSNIFGTADILNVSILTNIENMFCEEIQQDLSYISIYSLSILYNTKFILMAKSLGTNAIVLTRVHCNGYIVYSFPGKLTDSTISYSGYSSRVAQLNGAHPGNLHASQVRRTHNWGAQLFIDHIFRFVLEMNASYITYLNSLKYWDRQTCLPLIQLLF